MMMPTTTTTTTTTNSTTTTATSITNSQDTGGMQIPTPEHFICSISGDIFKDPVIAADGQTYERVSIEKWIATKEGQPVTSPLTGAILNNHMLTPNHMVKSMISSWQQKNKNGIDFNKALRTIEGEMLTAETTNNVIETISKIANLVQSSPKVLVTSEKINKWKKIIEFNSLLTTEVVSSFSVLESEIGLFLNKKTDELNKYNAIKDCQLLMIKSEEENSVKLNNEYIQSEKAYDEAKMNFENVKKSLLRNKQKLEILKKMNEIIELKIKNVKDAVGKDISNSNNVTGKKRKGVDEINNNADGSSNSSTTSSSSSSSSTSRRKKRRKNTTDNNNNNNVSVDLSVGAHELMMNGFLHLIDDDEYDAQIFIPLKYQTMIEISAYSGFDLAIGVCHIFGFGNFIKDAEKGYNIITKYYENNKNDSLSQNILGFLHYINIDEPLKGFETVDNKKTAFNFFSKSAEQGDAYGECWLGRCYCFGYGVNRDKKKAFDLFMKSAKQGSSIGQYYLGVAYEFGNGVAKDEKKAFEWYKKSAEQGFAQGQHAFAIFFRYGKGSITKNYNKALEWYKKASEQGYAYSSKAIGELYEEGCGDSFPKDETKALEWMTKATEQNSKLLSEIGENYLDGNSGCTKNYKVAFEFFTKSAQLCKNAESMQYIGNMYLHGQYVTKDYEKVEEWYHKAADHCKSGKYEFELAEFYRDGDEMPQNYTKAIEYYTKAIEIGEDKDYICWSRTKLGIMYRNGEGVIKDDKKAFEYFNKALEHEETDESYDAKHFLGIMYKNGEGVRKNNKKAFELFTKSVDEGEGWEYEKLSEVQRLLGNMYHYGYGIKKDLQQAKEWYEKAANDEFEDGEEKEADEEAIEMLTHDEFQNL